MESGQPRNKSTLNLRNCSIRLDRSEVDRYKIGGNRKKIHICPVCEDIFSSEKKLQTHCDVKHPHVRFPCGTCSKSCKTLQIRRVHVMEAHVNIQVHGCRFCDKTFTVRGSLISHENKHGRQVVKPKRATTECQICHKQLKTAYLGSHWRTHTDDRPHKCPHCEAAFRDAGVLKNHVLAVHEKKQNYKCDGCEKSFNTRSRMWIHRVIHSEKQFRCELCAKTFHRPYDLIKHVRVHTGEKPFKCSYCVQTFRSQNSATTHENTIHEQQQKKELQCRFCEKLFKRSGDRSAHEKFVHEGIGVQCRYCDKHFASEYQRSVHERIHTGEKKYACSYCHKSFTMAGNLGLHLKTHTGEKPHKCDQCHMAFSRANCLEQHKKKVHANHKSYPCSFCRSAFASATEKTTHEQTHSALRRLATFECCLCEKKFRYPSVLKYHMITHTREKHFKCSTCEKSFTVAGSRNIHEKTHLINI